MIDRAKIIEAYAEIEAEHGGYSDADAKAVLRLTAERMGITYEEARDVLLDEWGAMYG